LYGALKTKFPQIAFHQYSFYVYTDGDDPEKDYVAVDVSEKYAEKASLYDDVFECWGAETNHSLTIWNRVPARGHDLWFKNELRKKVADEAG
jgi:hypothetical protein